MQQATPKRSSQNNHLLLSHTSCGLTGLFGWFFCWSVSESPMRLEADGAWSWSPGVSPGLEPPTWCLGILPCGLSLHVVAHPPGPFHVAFRFSRALEVSHGGWLLRMQKFKLSGLLKALRSSKSQDQSRFSVGGRCLQVDSGRPGSLRTILQTSYSEG